MEIPNDLTPECQDLLSRIIVADPEKRATLQQVMQHAWTMGNEGDIQTFALVRQKPAYLDWRVVEQVCEEFEIEKQLAEQVMKGALFDWERFKHHEIVSLYFLTLEKNQRELPIATEQPFVKRVEQLNAPAIAKHTLSPTKIKTVYLKGLLSVTSSEKPASALAQEIARVLQLNRICYELRDAVFYCEYSPSIEAAAASYATPIANYQSKCKANPFLIQFKVQIVKIAFLATLGVQFGLILGDAKGYKNVCSHLLAEFNL